MEDSKSIFSINLIKKVSTFGILLLAFIISLNLLINSIDLTATEYHKILSSTSQTFFTSLFFGIITTAIVQSSSAITTLAVALVAEGDLTFSQATPIIIGSNIGTTITPFIFSFINSAKKGDFKKSLTIAFSHNLFNIITATIIVILEINYSALTTISSILGNYLFNHQNYLEIEIPSIVNSTIKPISQYLKYIIKYNWVGSIIGFIGMLASIKGFVWLFTHTKPYQNYTLVTDTFFKSTLRSFLLGIFSTALVHSSSATISILETVVCNYKISTKKAYSFVIGANIGTTFTAMFAGIISSQAALILAISHLVFNVLGAIFLLTIPQITRYVLRTAEYLSNSFEKNRSFLIIYISIIYFTIPILLIYLFK